MKFLQALVVFLSACFAGSSPVCPDNLYTSGYANDLGLLSELVSGDPYDAQGVCGLYKVLTTVDEAYDTRMRIYTSSDKVLIVFRPTQQTAVGGDIHVNRRLVQCDLFADCRGLVMERFQEAFLKLAGGINWAKFQQNEVYIGGHSLGGAFAVFMGVYLLEKYQIKPRMILGIAGPFIGDEVFNQNYLVRLKETVPEWYQIEDENRRDGQTDMTVEQYNVPQPPFISIYGTAVCKVMIDKLWDSYGMHDLRNYRLALNGKTCDAI